VRLYGNTSFAFQVHIVQELVCHFIGGNCLGEFDEPVGEGGFAVVDVGDDRKIANFILDFDMFFCF